jgi:hypothetical protein
MPRWGRGATRFLNLSESACVCLVILLAEAEVCSRYISKIEEVHEDFMHSISVFIDSFPHYAAEYQQNFEAMQQELIAVNRTSE